MNPLRHLLLAGRLPLALLALSIVEGLLVVPAVHAQSFEGLGFLPGGSSSLAFSVSADGSVVVGSSAGGGGGAFLWTQGGGMQGLGSLPGGLTIQANGVSAGGAVVVGYFRFFDSGDRRAFRWTPGGGMQILPILPGHQESFAPGVSASGAVAVGYSLRYSQPQEHQAVRWQGGAVAGLGSLPGHSYSRANAASADGSVIVGGSSNDSAFLNLNIGEAFRWTAGGGMQGIGGGYALGVSADGSVVVGVRSSATGVEAFRWTAGGGMQGIGGGYAHGVSADGSVVVGGSAGSPSQAFLWTAADGMRPLKAVLEDDHGLDLTGWELHWALGISDDGTVIAGFGLNPQGQPEAWRAVLGPGLALLGPPADTLLVAGEPHTIRWRRPEAVEAVDLYLLPDVLGAPEILLDFGLDTDSLVWTPPDTLFSRSARLVVKDFSDPSVADTSAAFRIKPYHLTRLSADSTRYVPFRPDAHGWQHGNTQANWFPPAWYGQPQFDYLDGTDPFTDDEYDDDFPLPPINGASRFFPDWPAYVRAFGTDAAYWLIIPGVEAFYRSAFTAAWGAFHGGDLWGGSCYGMASSALLAFTHREGFGARYPGVGPVEQLFTVGMSTPVRELVNAQFCYQGGRRARDAQRARLMDDPRTLLAALKAALVDDAAPPALGLLSMKGVTSCTPYSASGGHAVTAYRLERDASAAGRWRVLIYDPNLPGNGAAAVLVDSTANQWTYAGGLNWGGACGLFLRDPIANYLQDAEVDRLRGEAPGEDPAHFRDDGSPLYVAATPGADVVLASAAGSVGHAGGVPFNTLDGAIPEVPDVGGPAPPVGYEVPPGAYTLTLSAFSDSVASAYFFGPGVSYAYGRADAEAAHTDRLGFDPTAGLGGGLAARSDDAGVTKRVTLRAVVAEEGRERTLDARDLPLAGPDSVRFAVFDHAEGHRLRLANEGGAKAYTLRLRQAGADAAAAFLHAGVPLVAGAVHTVRPVWATLGEGPVEVDVDLDGDGEPDEVLVLGNQVANEPGGPAGLPAAFALEAAYPNPFRRAATLRYDVPAAGRVRLAVYDLLGREVAVLVDAEVAAGRHAAVLDGAGLATGVYVVRLAAGGRVFTQRVTRLR